MRATSQGTQPDAQVVELMADWQGLVDAGEVTRDCQLEVTRQEHWFVLSGWVGSFGAKCRLLALVPEHDGARWIVDRIRVGRPEASTSEDVSSDPVRSPVSESQAQPAL